jgi:D-glycero-alpha-D-manno-heptose-7-phosphate kinase
LAVDGIHVEQELLRETVGSQDQVMAAYGGLNHVRFLPNGEISVRPVIMPPQRTAELNAHVMLIYTGIVRTASEVANTYVSGIEKQRRQLRIINDLVKEGLAILTGDRDIADFGELVHEAWQVKRNLSQCVSNARIDDIYGDAIAAGAVGGKLLGAGGGGFLMLFVPPERQEAVRQKLRGLIHVPCNFESQGSQIIFLDPEKDYSKEETARAGQSVDPFRELVNAPLAAGRAVVGE